MDPSDAGNGAHSGDEPRSTSATPRTSRVVKREISTVSRASSQRRIAPGPSLLSRQPSAGNNLGTTSGKSFDGGLQSLSRTNSVKRVQSHVREKTGGLALSLVQQKATYSRPLSPEHRGDDVHLSTNGLHAGVCPNCRVSIDSTILQDAQVLTIPISQALGQVYPHGNKCPRPCPDKHSLSALSPANDQFVTSLGAESVEGLESGPGLLHFQ